MKTQSIEIRLAGQKVVLKSSDQDPALVKEVAELVSQRIRAAEKRMPKGAVAPHQVALLALMDLGQEYIMAKGRASGLKRSIEEKSAALLELLEAEQKQA